MRTVSQGIWRNILGKPKSLICGRSSKNIFPYSGFARSLVSVCAAITLQSKKPGLMEHSREKQRIEVEKVKSIYNRYKPKMKRGSSRILPLSSYNIQITQTRNQVPLYSWTQRTLNPLARLLLLDGFTSPLLKYRLQPLL